MFERSRIVAGLAFLVIAWGAEGALTQGTNSASVIINVPADAKLYFDGQLTHETGERRVFATPELIAGKK